jgi:hypothetical protein
MLVAGKMENGCASHRRRWSTSGTTPTAVITYAPRRQRAVACRILFLFRAWFRDLAGISRPSLRTPLAQAVRLGPPGTFLPSQGASHACLFARRTLSAALARPGHPKRGRSIAVPALAPPMVDGENLIPQQFRNSDKVSARNCSLVSLERVWHMRAALVGSAVLMPIQSCRRTKRRHVCARRGGPVLEDEDDSPAPSRT